jgi:hypothetical protein
MESRISLFTSLLAAATAAALALLTVASVRVREKPDTAERGLDVEEENDRRRAAGKLPGTAAAHDEALVGWIPIAVPLSAVVLALGVYLIYAAVL